MAGQPPYANPFLSFINLESLAQNAKNAFEDVSRNNGKFLDDLTKNFRTLEVGKHKSGEQILQTQRREVRTIPQQKRSSVFLGKTTQPTDQLRSTYLNDFKSLMKPANPSSNPKDKQSYSNAVRKLHDDKGFQTYISKQLKSPEDSKRIETIKNYSEKELNRYISNLSPPRIDPNSIVTKKELETMREKLDRRKEEKRSEELAKRVEKHFARDRLPSEHQRYLRGEEVGEKPTFGERALDAFSAVRKGARNLQTKMLTVDDGGDKFHHRTLLTKLLERPPMRSYAEEVMMQQKRQQQTDRWPAR